MADTKLSGLAALTAVATNDMIEVLDVSDTTSMSSAQGANKKITRSDFLAGVYIAGGGTAVALADGGTGATTASAARGSLGLDSMATQGSAAVAITGGTIGGITTFGGAAIGVNLQAWDADLDAFAGLTSGANLFPYYTGSHTMGTADFVPWTTWVPTLNGWSTNPPTNVYRYTQVGKSVTLAIRQATAGTSNAATKTLSLPVTPATVANMIWHTPCMVVDNNVNMQGGAYISSAGTAVGFGLGYGTANIVGGGFTTSGQHRITYCTITYEAV
jgi:hypothetical protein